MPNTAQDTTKHNVQNIPRDIAKSDAMGTLIEGSREAGRKAGELASRAADSMVGYYDTSRRYVAENPVKGVATAAAVGLVAGSLLALSFRRK